MDKLIRFRCRALFLLGVLGSLTVGCRFGGPPSPQFADYGESKPSDGSMTGQSDAGSSSAANGGSSAASGGAGGAGASASQAGSGGGAGHTAHGDAAIIDPVDDGGAGGSSLDPSCAPPATAPAVCDPVKGTGCASGMQCDVDLVQPTLSGRCAFNSPMDAGFCFTSAFTESCPNQQTCDNGVCRKVCFCDGDCDPGDCCSEALGTLGFKACVACP